VLLNKARQIEACTFSETLEFPLVLGRDFSGRVVAKGLGVGHYVNIGDDVWGALPAHLQGCHAQYVRVNKTLVRNCMLLMMCLLLHLIHQPTKSHNKYSS
jgi:NADPH:quinone reductase-like Zn-dependent oxidoreductase